MTGPAIVSDGWIGRGIRGTNLQLPEAWTLHDIASYAWASNCSSVLVLDGWSDDRAGMALAGGHGFEVKELGRPPFQWAIKHPLRPEVLVTSIECQSGSPFEGMGPRVVLSALEQWEQRTGSAWQSTVNASAERLIIDSWKGKRSFLEHKPIPAPLDRAVIASSELAYTWARDLYEEEQQRAFVHVFDINAQHLYEWKATRLPYDELEHHPRPHTFDPTIPGLWRVPELAEGSRGVFRTDLPSLLHGAGDRHTPGREWFTTWTLTEAAQRGISLPDISESITWTKQHAWLAHAGKTLEEVRARASIDKLIADQRYAENGKGHEQREAWRTADLLGTLAKRIYQTQTGMFAAASEGGSSIFHRPVWWAYIVGAARVRLYRKMDAWATAPFAVLTDAVMFATDEPDPTAFGLGVGLEISNEVGAFSHRLSAKLPGVIDGAADRIATGMAPVQAWMQMAHLNKLEGVRP